jgi:protein O-GlcNAc transferase
MPHSSYLLTLSLSDLFLDTIYYDAHTTASDGLYGALPILTRPVLQMSSRISSSLNRRVGVDAVLTTSSRREYVDVAIRLSRSQSSSSSFTNGVLFQIRRQIQKELGVKIFNSRGFSEKLERVYQAMQSLQPRIGHIYFTEESRE